MKAVTNPFFFEVPSDRWSFTDREDLAPRVEALMRDRARRLLVTGRRRMGKTSLIKKVGAGVGLPFVYCDVATSASLGELARKILAASPEIPEDHLSRVLSLASKYLKTVSISFRRISISGELRESDPSATLGGVLHLLNESAADMDQAWTVCFDEFQDIRLLGGPRVDWYLRGIMQEHTNLNYIFAGSDHRIASWMSDPSSPFFKQLELMDVGPIAPAHMAKWIAERAKVGGLSQFPYGDKIVALAGPCTGDIVRLAKAVFDMDRGLNGSGSANLVEKAFDQIALVENVPAFQQYWRTCTLVQKAVLRAVALGRQPTAAETLKEFGIRAPSTAATAIAALVDNQLLIKKEGGTAFDNPYFEHWVRSNAIAT